MVQAVVGNGDTEGAYELIYQMHVEFARSRMLSVYVLFASQLVYLG